MGSMGSENIFLNCWFYLKITSIRKSPTSVVSRAVHMSRANHDTACQFEINSHRLKLFLSKERKLLAFALSIAESDNTKAWQYITTMFAWRQFYGGRAAETERKRAAWTGLQDLYISSPQPEYGSKWCIEMYVSCLSRPTSVWFTLDVDCHHMHHVT